MKNKLTDYELKQHVCQLLEELANDAAESKKRLYEKLQESTHHFQRKEVL